jgi:hypothetical protein
MPAAAATAISLNVTQSAGDNLLVAGKTDT